MFIDTRGFYNLDLISDIKLEDRKRKDLYLSCIQLYFFVFPWTGVKLTGMRAAAEFL